MPIGRLLKWKNCESQNNASQSSVLLLLYQHEYVTNTKY